MSSSAYNLSNKVVTSLQVTADSVATGLVVAKPAEACGPLENDVRGKVVLVRRGSCAFVKKAEEVQAAGGRAMVVGSVHPYIVRMVCSVTLFHKWLYLLNIVCCFVAAGRGASVERAQQRHPRGDGVQARLQHPGG